MGKNNNDNTRYYQPYWELLLPIARAKCPEFENSRPNPKNHISATRAKVTYAFALKKHGGGQAEILFQQPEAEENLRFFEHCLQRKAAIENQFGRELVWVPNLSKKRSQIYADHPEIDLTRPQSEWPQMAQTMVDSMARLKKALSPYLRA